MEKLVSHKLEIPFKEFMAGQIIQSKHFNDDMFDIESKVNEIIEKHNLVTNDFIEHVEVYNNPHRVTAHQVGTYTEAEIDSYVTELKNGEFNDGVITNRVLGNECVDNRTLKDNSITASKVEDGFGRQIDISRNIDILDRYTKIETDELIRTKVGDGAYSKDEIDKKFQEVQVGQIVDKTISVDKVTSDFGEKVDISRNPSILSLYTKEEVDRLISINGLPRDWGSITESTDNGYSKTGILPVAGCMTAGQFKSPATSILDIDAKEIVEARLGYYNLNERLDHIENLLNRI